MQRVLFCQEDHFLRMSNNGLLVQLQVTHYCDCLGNEEIVNLFAL